MYAFKAAIACSPLFPGGALSSFVLNAANLKYDIAFQPTETFTLAVINFNVTGKTGSPTFTARIETDSVGRASGTLAWANATITGVAISANGWVGEATLTASGTVSAGTLYHLVIINDNGTPASNNFAVQDTSATFINGGNGWAGISMEAWTASFNGTVWATRSEGPIFALTDGSVVRQAQPFDGGTNIQTLSSTTAFGIRFTAPVGGSIFGLTFQHLPQAGIGTVTAKLYDTSDVLLATGTLSVGANTIQGSGRLPAFICFDGGAVSITSANDYRIVFNDSGSSDRIEYFTAPSTPADYRTVSPFTQFAKWTQGTTGAWTDTPGKAIAGLQLIMASLAAGGTTSPGVHPPIVAGTYTILE